MLLQQLDDTRQCSPLLEPEDEDSDAWEGREVSLSALPPSVPHSQSEDTDFDFISQATESAADFAAGTFRCKVVWETKFTLHSRLRTGPGKSLLSRGIQVFSISTKYNDCVSCDLQLILYLLPLSDATSDLDSL